jgi:phosphoadenosine phosphosulfate reductase
MSPELIRAARELDARLEAASLADVLRVALERFGAELTIACSLGVEDMVVLHEAARIGAELRVAPRVFLLDTGRLHQETYDLVDRARERYGIPLEVYAPDTLAVEELVRRKGMNSFYRSVDDRLECCRVRKVFPLRRALAGARAWVTGLRRDQSRTREELRVVEADAGNGGLLKFSPLAKWTEADVWAFVKEHGVPTHALHKRGYPSIGCAPCTRPVKDGENVRAGRWWWEEPQNKECGLHARGVDSTIAR